MEGEELSLFAITDGTNVVPLLPAQDHKRLLDDDLGPNTGGMGAYAPVSIGTQEVIDVVCDRILEPTLAALKNDQSEFRGLLYAGLMITSEGPKVVEFNCRFGDPETQAILPLMNSSLLDLFVAVANADSLRNAPEPEWLDAFAVTTVLAAGGYPQSPRSGEAIRLPAVPNEILVFHAGTKRGAATGELLTAGGRVLAITAVAETLHQAADASRSFAERVSFEGKQMRRDIARRELERHARVT
jgi:phosphoribosylamine--glycine ligase